MSVPYTDSEASEARQWSNRYGPPNAWTASFGTAARMIGRLLDERERLMAEAMLRERSRSGQNSSGGTDSAAKCTERDSANHDAAPAARARTDADSDRENERSVASAGSAAADGPTRAEIFAALDTLTRAIGCYGERIAAPFVIRCGNGIIAGLHGEFEAGGIDNVTSRIARLQGRDWRTL